MGGQELDLAERRHAQLDARASQLLASDPLLDDSALLAERPDVAVIGRALRTRDSASERLAPISAASPHVPGRREAPEVDERVSFARDSLVQLHQHLLEPRPLARISDYRRRRGPSCDSAPPARADALRPRSAKSRRQPLFVPKWRCLRVAPYNGIPSSRARSRSKSVTFRVRGGRDRDRRSSSVSAQAGAVGRGASRSATGPSRRAAR